MARLSELLVEVRDAASRFEADRWSGDDCVRLAEELSRTAKACAAASARAAARAVACHQRDVEWVARTAGSTPAQARDALATTVALEQCPATGDAAASGAVSLSQAREIARAEAAVPGSEGALLEVAATRGMAGLREESRRIVLGAIDRNQLHARQRAARSVRHWVDDDGMVAGQFRLPPEVGVPFANLLDRETDRLLRAARRVDSHEPREAFGADALLALARGSGKGRSGRADVVFVCDLRAAVRGHTHEGEPCHVVGGGPVPVEVVRAAAVDAFVKAVLRDGTKLDTIVHYGRHIPAVLQTALDLGDPERLEGAVCCEPGCDRRYDLERDHVDPVANQGVTSYENLQPRCRPHHRSKTERDRDAGLLGRGGRKRGPP